MTTAHAWAAHAAETPFAPFSFERRELGPHDVRIDILHCGVCHSDIHFSQGEWGDPRYPCVPGHEIVGRVSAVGSSVTGFAVGDLAGVGCLVDSCGACPSCGEGLEQYCENGATGTYNGTEKQTGLPTYGGYSNFIVVREDFVLRINHGEPDLAAVAPLLCAGITLWSPLRHWQTGPGKTVGIAGIGGLGHMGLKLAHALGARVLAFTTSPAKADEARRLGADEVVNVRDADDLARHAGSVDLIVNTVSAHQDLSLFTRLLRRDGTLVLVGAGEQPTYPNSFDFLARRISLAGSAIGGIAETQEMLDFCAQHGIVADIEQIAIQQVDEAYERILASDVRYRFVIDMSTLPAG
ncbi:NAD(P)-dependent alcohol dehydrogenase [Novosphingobium colocasiae]|uniref:NAD(P)-dependent alcohol dehydrogenase n=1 Tax=Novosphingobium colocasiae TaxID=1256513 RepID=UPI0035AE42DD